MERQELLNCAADHIEKVGISHGVFFDMPYSSNRQENADSCPACVFGAAMVCLPQAKRSFMKCETAVATELVRLTLGLTIDEQNRVFEYNDSHTKEEVVTWLRAGMPL